MFGVPLIVLLLLLPLNGGAQNAAVDDGVQVEANSSRNLQFTEEALNCNSVDRDISALCDLALRKVNSELKNAGITITPSEIIFQVHDDTTSKIETGHSCTITAQLLSTTKTVSVSRETTIDFEFESFSEPIAILVEVPASYYEEYRIRQRAGIEILFGCSNLGRDTYFLRGGIETTAQLAILIDLQPKILVSTNPVVFKVSVNPKVIVLFDLASTDLELSSSGLSPITSIWHFVAGLSSTGLKFLTSIFKGESVKKSFEELKEGVVLDFAIPLTLVLSQLPRPLREVMLEIAEKIFLWKQEKDKAKVLSNLEDKIENSLEEALNVNVNAGGYLTLPKDLIRTLGDSSPWAQGQVTLKDSPAQCWDFDPTPGKGGNLYLYPSCIPGLNQRFYFERDTRRIKSLWDDGLCLDHDPNFDNVYFGPCHGMVNQRWSYNPDTNEVKSDAKPYCLDWNGISNLYMHPCHGGANQKFLFPYGFWGDDFGGIHTPANYSLCWSFYFDPKCSHVEDCVNVGMALCDGSLNQQFYYDRASKAIKNAADGAKDRCLDSNGNKGNVYMYPCHGGSSQRWYFDGATAVVKSESSSNCVDYLGGPSGNLYMHPCHQGANQKFLFPADFW